MREDTEPSRRTLQHVLALLNDLDPYGLEPGLPDGAPADEYDLEAAPIAQILTTYGAVTVEQVDTVWLKWFGQPLTAVVGPGEITPFVANLNRLVEPRAPRKDKKT
ncbi:hypothetical protein ACIGB8_18255 [Promicromonospora sukumoe]|uniref:hypothetical protein n=1 Tax=Promicromonospora sukumoe TaxID=88382 RepID=UPI0037C95663